MAQFFLFAEDRDTLERRVNNALVGYRPIGGQKALPYSNFDEVLRFFDPGAGTPWRGGTSNPFKLTDYKTKQQLFPPAEGDVGWGVPLAGDAADVGELAAIIRSANSAEDPLIRSTLGGEFGARILVDAPNWQNWTTGTGRGRTFGTRGQARSLIRADALATKALTGKGVGVFVVDRGISQHYVESLGGDYGGGFVWDPGTGPVIPGQADLPFQKTRREHGALVVRSILDLAPEATIWDLPLLPPQIKDVTGFALVASFAYFALWVVTAPDFPHL
ncbi:MAG: hypothetical protein AAF961_19375, partial [Planctomycetota bacterium]